jgi:hypothetical protein
MSRAQRLGQRLAHGGVGREGRHLGPRRHDVARQGLAEAEDALEHVGLLGLERAALLALGDEDLEVLGRRSQLPLAGRLHPQDPHDPVARPVEEVDEGGEELAEELEGPRRHEHSGLGPLDGERLRRQLAEDDVEHGDDDEGDDHRSGARGRVAQADRLEDRPQQLGEGGLAQPAQAQACERDAELAGGEVAVDVLHLLAREHRGAPALLGQLLEAGRARAGERELGRDEEAVQQHQEECRDDLDRVRQRSGRVSTDWMIPGASRRPPAPITR